MTESKNSMSQQLSPEEELGHFKNVVSSVMDDASKALAFIELHAHGAELEEQLDILDHYIDYVRRLCKGDKGATVVPFVFVDGGRQNN